MFIRDRIDQELHSLERLELKFGLSSEFFDKIPVRILLDVLCRVFRFSKASFYALASFIHNLLKLRRHLDTETYVRLPWQFCNFTCEITNYKQLLDEVFVISGIINVISRSRRLRLITLTETLIIPDITKTESNNCFIMLYPQVISQFLAGSMKRIEKPFLLRCPRTWHCCPCT